MVEYLTRATPESIVPGSRVRFSSSLEIFITGKNKSDGIFWINWKPNLRLDKNFQGIGPWEPTQNDLDEQDVVIVSDKSTNPLICHLRKLICK